MVTITQDQGPFSCSYELSDGSVANLRIYDIGLKYITLNKTIYKKSSSME